LKRVVIANFYPVWPVIGGGQRRIFFLARELSKVFDVEIIVPDRLGVCMTTFFGSRLRETRIGVGGRFRSLEIKVNAEAEMAADVAYALHWEECDLYNDLLTERLASADIAATVHPYSIYPLLRCRAGRNIPIIFDSQNVELRQKASVLASTPRLLNATRDVEATALRSSQRVIACSREDAVAFAEDYGIDATQVTIVENGVDARGVPAVPEEIVGQLRERLGLSSDLIAVFGGSFHHPNFRAAERIVELAKGLPTMKFIILGGVCNYEPLKRNLPRNVICMGEVDESTKWMAFGLADIGLNPMETGSGTNIKMFEYAAAGLPVLSSPFGARGIGLEAGREFIVCELDEMLEELGRLKPTDRGYLKTMGLAANKSVTAIADWSVIGKRYIECFQEVLG
jgi:glycosyltransferase involved in cell wall biosynthesis